MKKNRLMVLNDKKTINGWALYDWANSAYFLVISTAIFPAYFLAQTSSKISIFGMELTNSSVFSYAVSLSYLVIVILSPILSGISDYSGKRMFFLKLFTYLGSISCIALSFFSGDSDVWIGISAFMLATIGASGGIVFYNAYLPEIATEDKYDEVSARGFAFGYIGSVLLLVFILFMSLKPLIFGIPEGTTIPYRLGFALVGIWWIGFAQITFRRLPKDKRTGFSGKVISKGIEEIKKVFTKVRSNPHLLLFLAAFFFYSAGVQTVVYLASIFAKQELMFSTDELIIVILILQLVAIIGAYLFAIFSKKLGNKLSLIIQVIIWAIIAIVAYMVQSKLQFYILAGMVGMVLGGIQSQSRSAYSKIVESQKNDLTSYFSFYDIVFKISIVVGTFAFGIVNEITGDLRKSVLSLAFFFVLGLVLLLVTNFRKAEEGVKL